MKTSYDSSSDESSTYASSPTKSTKKNPQHETKREPQTPKPAPVPAPAPAPTSSSSNKKKMDMYSSSDDSAPDLPPAPKAPSPQSDGSSISNSGESAKVEEKNNNNKKKKSSSKPLPSEPPPPPKVSSQDVNNSTESTNNNVNGNDNTGTPNNTNTNTDNNNNMTPIPSSSPTNGNQSSIGYESAATKVNRGMIKKNNSERTIDAFLNDVTSPTSNSESESYRRNNTPQGGFRTPEFGVEKGYGGEDGGVEMRDIDLASTPKREFQDTGASANSKASTKPKLNLRRPYAKTNEIGWRQSHWLRKRCIIASDSVKWEVAVLLLIIGNCITLAMASPLDDPESSKAKTLSGIEMFFSIAFTIELVAKIIAMGYYTDENAYMRDNWNILDFIIVMGGWLSEVSGGGGGLTAMRAMRVLRPLRTIKGIPELKRIIEGMIASIPQLSTVFGLCFGCYLLFGILGMQLFSGKMSQRCQDDTTKEWDMDSGRYCSLDSGFGRQCPDGSTCGDSGVSLNSDITNFDDVFRAVLTVFQSCTLEGWVDAMYCLMDTMPSVVPGIFFVTLIWVGSLFLLNLVTVVVYIAYSQSADKIAELTDGPGDEEALVQELEVITDKGVDSIEKNVAVLAMQAVEDLQSLRKRNPNATGDEETNSNDSFVADPVHEHEHEHEHHAVQLSKIASVLSAALHQLQTIPNVVIHGGGYDFNASHKKKDDDSDIPKYENSPGKFICYQIVVHPWFTVFMNFLIVSNTVCLASEYHGMSQAHTDFLVTANVWFTVIFTFEIYAKLKGLGVNKFREDPFNTFDSAIVFVSLIELMIGGEGGGGISALRSFRIMRLFKLLRSWVTLRRILKNMAMTMSSSSAFIGLLCLLIFVFSLVGMTMYGGTFEHECEEDSNGETVCYAPRANYDSLFTSAVVSFQIMTMENWNEVLYISVENNGYIAVLFPVINLLVGGFLMMNIFLAILIDNYALAVQQEIEKKKAHEKREKERARIKSILAAVHEGEDGPASPGEDDALLYAESDDSSYYDDEETNSSSDEEEHEELDEDEDAEKLFKDPTLHPAYAFNSLCVLRSGGKLRHMIFKLVLWPVFDKFVLTLIIMNCITLALDEPGADGLGPQGTLGDALEVLGAIFTYAFIIEFVLKILAFGLILHPGSYARNNWNLLDGLIVITSIIELASASSSGGDDGEGSSMGAIRALRALRALRPLRLISRLEGLQIVINTMLRAFKPCASVGAVAMVFYTVFSIVGVNFFGGKFYSCNDITRTCSQDAPGMDSTLCLDADACTGNYTNDGGEVVDRVWANPTYEDTGKEYSFDNFFAAMLVLFEVASLEMWPSVMYSANDVTEVGYAPKHNASEGNSLFFVLFISVMTFFIMELFVTVIIDNFNEIKAERDGSAYMTEKQIEWVRTQKQLASRKPKKFIAPPPESAKVRYKLFFVVTSEKFEMLIMGFIIANIGFMMTEHKGQIEEWSLVLEIMNYIFAFVFTLEMILKWFAMGTTAYFSSGWNRFDFTIVMLTIVSLILDWCNVELPFDPTLLRVGRIARVFRLVKSSESLKAITQTIFLSLPSMANVGMVLMLIFFIFAVAGMNIFGGVPKGDFITTWCNFDTFIISVVTLFRCATGESWNGLMHDTMVDSALSVGYFVLFQLVASYVLLNLFVAIILDQMSDQMDAVKEQAQQLKYFSDAWKAVKLNSVGGDVLALALNSSNLVTRKDGGDGDGENEKAAEGDEEGGGDGRKKAPRRGISRGSIFERFPSMASPSDKKQKRWAQKEKNVSFMPAYYLKKLVRRLPAPLGLAEVVDDEDLCEDFFVNGRKMRRPNEKLRETLVDGNIRINTEANEGQLLKFIRECDIPLVDGDWVRYKDVLHSIFFRCTRKAAEENPDDDSDADSDADGGPEWFHLQQFQRNLAPEQDPTKMYRSEISMQDSERETFPGDVEVVDNSLQLHQHTADEWFGAVVLQAWFRGSRGRMKFEKEKDAMIRRRNFQNNKAITDTMKEVKRKKKKEKKEKKKKSSRDREGGSKGRKYTLKNADV
ncbi:hypothetical protein TrST_g4693 [Triparma strigata]|uniref:Ion transport domain-containing protein n=1 Tax=Triparma strigata TaxID=1606541 RepID=A0A9W7AFP9_9STRA|nr:hypothetical protein TrST_g4693 [Triparma strigata]